MPCSFSAGETFSFAVDFHGVPATGILIANNRHGDRGWVSNPWPNKARNLRAVIDHPSDRIGPYSYEKLAQVQANGVGGGMELASSIFYGYGATGAGRQLIAHEMAHQYWGDAVTESDWDDVWLSEGFATYFALLYREFEDGHDAFVEGVRRGKRPR